jgi:hypothetical protein
MKVPLEIQDDSILSEAIGRERPARTGYGTANEFACHELKIVKNV